MNERRLSDAEKQRMRQNFQVPIYYMYSSDVPRHLADAGLLGVMDIVRASGQRREIYKFGPEIQYGSGQYANSDWYVNEAQRRTRKYRDLGLGQQIDANHFFFLFGDEPWQQHPHWEVLLTNRDLWNGNDNNGFIFGVTDPDFPASVQSVKRITASIKDQTIASALTRRLVGHEVGHMFGLVNRGFNVENNLGVHCTNVCMMRQGLSTQEWMQQLYEESVTRTQLCQDCSYDLQTLSRQFISLR